MSIPGIRRDYSGDPLSEIESDPDPFTQFARWFDEALAARDAEARAAGIMVLPGAGFDVVPSDCLAAHLKRRLPSAT